MVPKNASPQSPSFQLLGNALGRPCGLAFLTRVYLEDSQACVCIVKYQTCSFCLRILV